uniref:DNA primase large subunit C-terminal domain-containing protein n=1 Tax=Noctiluca scintillans TaxID=2966 RepID=A0A7S1AKC8_NOCSC|mmetsp:Transcript_49941/g.132768  ORF Transcript_49941/g.132768 Transcript_49941/m.132768 type:complete len:502 (+) Transcript_49941:58-1563(+)
MQKNTRPKKENVNAFENDDLGLSFYETAPAAEVSVREFEEYAQQRLRLLHAFDRLGYEAFQGNSDQRHQLEKPLIESGLVLRYPTTRSADGFAETRAEFVRRDSISHFALRIAFSQSRETRDWFLRQEQRLFMLRFEVLKQGAREDFLTKAGVQFTKFAQDSSDVMLRNLQMTTPGAKLWTQGSGHSPQYESNFYEMPFSALHPSLISSRRVVIRRGTAYVPSESLKLIVAAIFKDRLSKSLETAFHGFPVAIADPRIGEFMRLLQTYGLQLLGGSKSSEDLGEKLSLQNFDKLMERSFPPCMRRLVEKQRERKKHLKHAGRLQLRPFLKACGFTMEESLKWWKDELTADPEIDVTSYEKNYVYDTEHAYGKKGHHQGQNAFGCAKLIGFPAEGAGQVHGCPFKQLDMSSLRKQMFQWHTASSNVDEIEKLINNGKHYQLACVEYFKSQHTSISAGSSEGDGVGNTPDEFYRESCRFHAKKNEAKDAKEATKDPSESLSAV